MRMAAGPGAGANGSRRRDEMVENLRSRGIRDQRVLAAMAQVPREQFVPAEFAGSAYDPGPLPIGAGQTVSAPYIVAAMTEALALEGGERVLEIGTGRGYAAAVLSHCAGEVITIEYHDQLAAAAQRTLGDLGYHNVEVRTGDGSRGAPDRAPFDAISVAALAADQLPSSLIDQLTPAGVLLCPVGRRGQGELLRYRGGHIETLMPVAFVPLIQHGN